ncbi:MAG: anthranilate synthase component I family protein [Planctomycetota bacterium]
MFPQGQKIDYPFGPAEALRRWPAGRPVVMLHSGRLDRRWSRWSLIGEPTGALTHTAGRSGWIGDRPDALPTWTGDPFRDLEAVLSADPAWYVGHLGYDLARAVERLPSRAADDHGWPDLQFQRCPNVLVFDHAEEKWRVLGPEPEALPDLSSPTPDSDLEFTAGPVRPDRTRAEHEAAVRAALDYIAAGDVFQVNLAHRFRADFDGSIRGLYLRLADRSPAWYGAYLELLSDVASETRLVTASTSPELFLELDGRGGVTTRPIKGTRPAHADPGELLDSAKDTAELNMIIDLLRNDLGRVCRYGSVRVTQPRTVESHPTVHHGVATVHGTLHRERSLRHLLRATFPGGSITGAPKVRAMEVIDELEPVRRGPYCGAVGWLRGACVSEGGHAVGTLSVAIRTLLIDRDAGRVGFSVGGGIVADSDPAAEYDETLDKAAALRAALGDGAGHQIHA